MTSSLCQYALCEKHMRAGVIGVLRSDLLSFRRSLLSDCGGLLFMTGALFLCNALYMPVLKTALMITACHPYFQCLFPTCGFDMWQRTSGMPHRDYALALLLSFVIFTFFGIGFPFVLEHFLRRRSICIGQFFFSPCYDGHFGSSAKTVNLAEWLRFSSTDPTALGTLYKSYELRWIAVPPVLLYWKIALLMPPVFAESGSFEQSIGIAVVEFCYGLFIFVTQPALAPMTDLMFQLGAVHQMIFLGLQNLDVYYRYHHGAKGSISFALVGTTLGYLCICVMCIIWSKVAPAVQSARRREYIGKLLVDLGMQYSANTSLYRVLNHNSTSARHADDERQLHAAEPKEDQVAGKVGDSKDAVIELMHDDDDK